MISMHWFVIGYICFAAASQLVDAASVAIFAVAVCCRGPSDRHCDVGSTCGEHNAMQDPAFGFAKCTEQANIVLVSVNG